MVYLNTPFRIALKDDTTIEQKAYKIPCVLYVVTLVVCHCLQN